MNLKRIAVFKKKKHLYLVVLSTDSTNSQESTMGPVSAGKFTISDEI